MGSFTIAPRWVAFSVLACAILVACGGGDTPEQATGQVQGVVLAEGPQSARVFLDLNNNQSYDAGEPATQASSGGAFTLDVGSRTDAELASATLVAELGQSADASTLMAPAAAFMRAGRHGGMTRTTPAVISPLTTLVAAQVTANGVTPAEGVEIVQQALGLEGKDLMGDYVARGDTELRKAAEASRANRVRAALPMAAEVLASAGRTRFIVKLHDGPSNPRDKGKAAAANHGGELNRSFSRALKAYVVTVPDDRVSSFLESMQRDTDVDFVEADQVVRTTQTVQANATWGIDRTDQRSLPLSTNYTYLATGAGVRAYIIDTGIRATHAEFQGRMEAGFTAISDGNGTNDCNGHGTHVAGTVGGTTWGMAKGVKLVPVRVLDCGGSGTISGVIAGLDWVAANAVKPAVANMSLGGGASTALDAAVANAVSAGITVVVAAGNENANACNVSPAREPSAITVGATTNSDNRSSFSNFGNCLDVFAPGSSIMSASHTSDSASASLSGTSMASPHAAGLAALYLQSNQTASPAQVLAAMTAAATVNTVVGGGTGSPNLLIYADLSTQSAPVEPPISSPEPPISSPEPPISEPAPPPGPGVSVGALSGRTVVSTRNWRASVTVAVKNPATGNLVPGVNVQGAFTVGGSKVSCKTATNGTCVITSGSIALATTQTQFRVNNLVARGLPYAPAHNVATTIVVTKP